MNRLLTVFLILSSFSVAYSQDCSELLKELGIDPQARYWFSEPLRTDIQPPDISKYSKDTRARYIADLRSYLRDFYYDTLFGKENSLQIFQDFQRTEEKIKEESDRVLAAVEALSEEDANRIKQEYANLAKHHPAVGISAAMVLNEFFAYHDLDSLNKIDAALPVLQKINELLPTQAQFEALSDIATPEMLKVLDKIEKGRLPFWQRGPRRQNLAGVGSRMKYVLTRAGLTAGIEFMLVVHQSIGPLSKFFKAWKKAGGKIRHAWDLDRGFVILSNREPKTFTERWQSWRIERAKERRKQITAHNKAFLDRLESQIKAAYEGDKDLQNTSLGPVDFDFLKTTINEITHQEHRELIQEMGLSVAEVEQLKQMALVGSRWEAKH